MSLDRGLAAQFPSSGHVATTTSVIEPVLDIQHLFPALPGAHLVVTADPDHIIVAVTDDYLRATLTGRSEIVGQRLFEVFPDNPTMPAAHGVSNLRLSLARAVATGTSDRMLQQRYDVRRPDGSFEERWWEPVNTPLLGPGGRVAHILHTAVNVTASVIERRSAAAAMAADRGRAAHVPDSVAEGFILLDRDFRVMEVNAEALRIDGRAREALMGRHLLEMWPEIGNTPPWTAFERGMAERRAIALEYSHLTQSQEIWLDVRAYPVAEGDGGLALFFRDATSRRTFEVALNRSEERFRALMSASSDVLYSMSPDWSEMRQLTGGGFLSDTGDPNRAWLAEYIHEDDQARVMAAVGSAVRTKSVFELEHRVRQADGTLGWTLSRAVPLLDERGEIKEWFGAATDVTARKNAEASLRTAKETLEARVAERTAALTQAVEALHAEALERERVEATLRQAQKMEALGQLTGGIAHDFNNMLQAIGGSLELASYEVQAGRTLELGRYLDVAAQTVERAGALTHRLLAFSRRQALLPKPVDTDKLVQGVTEMIRRTVGPGIQVELEAGCGSWPVLCDPNQLESAILNLAVNARDAMAKGGRLVIHTADVSLREIDVAGQEGSKPGDYVEIAVTDTGSGMNMTTQARAFEPFFTTKPMGQGTGLGLSQVYGFVRQSRGIIRLDSAPGRGTTIRLYLPRHHQDSDVAPGKSELAGLVAAGDGQTVLLVEDEAPVREMVAGCLRRLGYQVMEAADGLEALRMLHADHRRDIRALVSDVGLPGGLNGRQVAEIVRESRPDLPVLFITGYAGDTMADHLAPGMSVANKPFKLEMLAARVKAMMEPLIPSEDHVR